MRFSLTILVSLSTLLQAEANSQDNRVPIRSKQLSDVWRESTILESSLELRVREQSSIVSLPPELSEAGIGTKSKSNNEYHFWRISNEGMRLDRLGEQWSAMNVTASNGITLNCPSENMEGLNRAIIKPVGKTDAQAHWLSISLLYWLDPLATTLCTEISKLDQLGVANDGILTIALGEHRATFSRDFHWRPLSVHIDRDGIPVARTVFKYTFDQGKLVLESLSYKMYIEGKLHLNYDVEIESNQKTPSKDELKISIPPFTYVADEIHSQEYLVRQNGSIRRFSKEERGFASSWKDLLESEEGDLLPSRSSWLRNVLMLAGGAVLLAGAYKALRRNK